LNNATLPSGGQILPIHDTASSLAVIRLASKTNLSDEGSPSNPSIRRTLPRHASSRALC
jgi:hypothetical protein